MVAFAGVNVLGSSAPTPKPRVTTRHGTTRVRKKQSNVVLNMLFGISNQARPRSLGAANKQPNLPPPRRPAASCTGREKVARLLATSPFSLGSRFDAAEKKNVKRHCSSRLPYFLAQQRNIKKYAASGTTAVRRRANSVNMSPPPPPPDNMLPKR